MHRGERIAAVFLWPFAEIVASFLPHFSRSTRLNRLGPQENRIVRVACARSCPSHDLPQGLREMDAALLQSEVLRFRVHAPRALRRTRRRR
jgi:hypothetical protein